VLVKKTQEIDSKLRTTYRFSLALGCKVCTPKGGSRSLVRFWLRRAGNCALSAPFIEEERAKFQQTTNLERT